MQATASLSKGVKNVREQMEGDSELGVLMSSLRGANLNDDDFAAAGQQVNLMSAAADGTDADSGLPLTYEPDAISEFWSIRPVSVVSRMLQLAGISADFLIRLAWDAASGQLEANEVRRAIQIRDIVTSLGPAYIKLGQALSIRPDLLSPTAMNELQKLCDKVPSFDTDVAMAVIDAELGQPWQAFFSELSPAPIAAASLGQVYRGKLHTGAHCHCQHSPLPRLQSAMGVSVEKRAPVGWCRRGAPALGMRGERACAVQARKSQ